MRPPRSAGAARSPVVGPVFLEFIRRKGDDGFGEGNFRALFEVIEQRRIERGVPKAG